MSSRSITTLSGVTQTLVRAVAISMLAMATACGASSTLPSGAGGVAGASDINACALLTPAVVQQALGAPGDSGVSQHMGATSACAWGLAGHPAANQSSVFVNLDQPLIYDRTNASARRGTGSPRPVSGLGYPAFVLADATGAQSLYIRLSAMTMIVGVNRSGASAEVTQALEKTIANSAEGRLRAGAVSATSSSDW